MKKYLFILAGLLCLIGQSEVEAKAVKLGRGGNLIVGGGVEPEKNVCSPCTSSCSKEDINAGKKNAKTCYCKYHSTDRQTCSGHEIEFCGVNCVAGYCSKVGGVNKCSKCADGYFPNADGHCDKCTTIKITDTESGAVVGTTLKCDPETGKVTQATCNANLYPKYAAAVAHSSEQHICSHWSLTCANGYRPITRNDNSACCVPMCQGVSCVSGYTATPETGKCVCKPTNAGNCVQFQDGTATCTKCQLGYYLDGQAKCRKCPANATCNGTSSWSCNAHHYRKYFPMNGTGAYSCLECPKENGNYNIATCPVDDPNGLANSQTFTCNSGYIEYLFERDGSLGGAYWGCKACSEEIEGCSACNYNNNGAIQCTACGTGYYNAAKTITPACYMKDVCVTNKNGYLVCRVEQVCPAVSTVAMCEPCPDGCSACSLNNNGSIICSACSSNSLLQNNSCVACPSGATCNGTSSFTCASNTYPRSWGCAACPDHATCNGTDAPTCACGYERQYFPINGTGFYACIESSNVAVACATAQQQANDALMNMDLDLH